MTPNFAVTGFRRAILFLGLVLLAGSLSMPASAATKAPKPPAAAKPAPAPAPALPPPPPAPADNPPPPYEDQLLRLSEILGAVHYLRGLCGGEDGTLWRDQMLALLRAEQPDDTRRSRFVDRFNHGYEGFRAVYVACTPAATLAVDRYLAEGAKIAREVAARYGK